VSIPHAFALSALATLSVACAHAVPTPTPTVMPAAAAPSELWCGPIACPAWLASETAPGPLPLRERCGLLSKVLMFQPLSLVGRPLSAFETSQQTGIGRIAQRLATAVSLHTPEAKLEKSWFAAGETCGAGLLILAPSATQGDAEDAGSVFRLTLTPRDPASSNAFEFTLTAEALKPEVSTSAFKTLSGRAERGSREGGPGDWTVSVQASVNSADALTD
jgi:hypothetical protein